MVRLIIRGPVEATTAEFALRLGERLTAALKALGAGARVLGPAPAPFARLRGKYRFQIQVHASDADELRAAVRCADAEVPVMDEIQWIADIDPLDML